MTNIVSYKQQNDMSLCFTYHFLCLNSINIKIGKPRKVCRCIEVSGNGAGEVGYYRVETLEIALINYSRHSRADVTINRYVLANNGQARNMSCVGGNGYVS